ncbi:MAG: hypothetical protein SV775_15245 [Thermodesulfobacteriota bacterium]|nr:hypothetical protein [Thermodesulfobacteriota bacterium]
MNKEMIMCAVGISLSVLFYTSILVTPTAVEARPKVVAVEGMSFCVNSSMADNLKSLTGNKVYVTLDSGKCFAGFVKGIGDHLVHLEKLEGKDYFDVLICIEDISAIDARFRNTQR